jgi:hypothetical protein
MAQLAVCVKCEGSFEAALYSLPVDRRSTWDRTLSRGSAPDEASAPVRVMLIQCVKCGGVVGVWEPWMLIGETAEPTPDNIGGAIHMLDGKAASIGETAQDIQRRIERLEKLMAWVADTLVKLARKNDAEVEEPPKDA